jgi:16S rRNA (cytidine1402-2'-O)-methyltransferase
VTSEVALSGFRETEFVFGGFLPHKPGPRRRQLADLAAGGRLVVLFESPYRLLKLLDDIEAVLESAEVFVGRELTKRFEESRRGSPAEIRAAYADRNVKGELTVVIRPGPVRAAADGACVDTSGRG